MNPSYRTFIDVTLLCPVLSQSIVLRRVQYLSFVPRQGDVIRLTSTDEASTLDITVENVVFNAAEGDFIIDVCDESVKDRYAETGVVTSKEEVSQYQSFDFQVLK